MHSLEVVQHRSGFGLDLGLVILALVCMVWSWSHEVTLVLFKSMQWVLKKLTFYYYY